MPEVEVAVNVMASPSQNVEDDADDAYAVEVKLIIGLSAICTTISGEKEEQPATLKDSTLILLPVIKVLVVSTLEPDLTPKGLSSL